MPQKQDFWRKATLFFFCEMTSFFLTVVNAQLYN